MNNRHFVTRGYLGPLIWLAASPQGHSVGVFYGTAQPEIQTHRFGRKDFPFWEAPEGTKIVTHCRSRLPDLRLFIPPAFITMRPGELIAVSPDKFHYFDPPGESVQCLSKPGAQWPAKKRD